jgi:hypothetical protein
MEGIVYLKIFISIGLLMGLMYGYGLGKHHKFKTYRYYQNNNGLYLLLLTFSFLIAMIPIMKKSMHMQTYMHDGFFFVFFIYLIMFKISDTISRVINNRPMHLTMQGSAGNWKDGLLTVIIYAAIIFGALHIGKHYLE